MHIYELVIMQLYVIGLQRDFLYERADTMT